MRWLCVLETMWDWRGMTSGAGRGEAPSAFCINPANFSGRRLYYLTGEKRGCLWCTNVCRELVSHPSQHGTPDVGWLAANLKKWTGIMGEKAARFGEEHTPAVLVCGVPAQRTYSLLSADSRPHCRTVYLPHPANRTWTTAALARARRFVQEGACDLYLNLDDGQLRARALGKMGVGRNKETL